MLVPSVGSGLQGKVQGHHWLVAASRFEVTAAGHCPTPNGTALFRMAVGLLAETGQLVRSHPFQSGGSGDPSSTQTACPPILPLHRHGHRW